MAAIDDILPRYKRHLSNLKDSLKQDIDRAALAEILGGIGIVPEGDAIYAERDEPGMHILTRMPSRI
ncbi:hypothetical protein [Methylococcus geothermalis]|uniref:Uncharacterized protein n=1 Tax=Methylococcus geothermalis TaxID=2681310 RepID=A0A858QBM3_9GAMM|nr:hypothetical protein [Methylococcus geothermalis]QJD31181.1 hypothetical protein GNH96_15355 [Methylococcus geothermalis]